MADIKTLQTRIALKHDTWAAWHDETKENQGANLVLLKGEIGFCEIPSGNSEATTAPTVLFKVGDGTTPFKTLKWASALAADVYSWAKAADVVLEGKSIKFVNGTGENSVVVKEIPIPYMTESDVTAITNGLNERLAAVEAKFTGDASVDAKIEAAKQAAIDAAAADATTKAGNAETAAKAYTDEKLGTAAVGETPATGIRKEIADAQAAAVAAAEVASEAKVKVERERIDAIDEANATRDQNIADNKKAVEDEAKAREDADKAINDKIGTVAEGSTVAGLIEDAHQAARDAQADVDALTAEGGAVTKNAADIAANAEDIAENKQAIIDEAAARAEEDGKLSGRIAKVEAFFANAEDENGKYTGLNDALDTLVEIQGFLKGGEGEEANGLFGAINANAAAIEALEGVVGDVDSGLVKDMAAAEEAIIGINADIDALEALTAGFAEGDTIKAKIDDAAALAQTGVDNAATAQAAAEAAQGEVDALEGVVATLRSEYDVTAALSLKNKEDIAALDGRMTTAEGAIEALEAIVNAEGENSNAQLRADIEALEAIVVDGDDSNAKLRAEVDRVAGLVDDTATGLAATKAIADQNTLDIADHEERLAAVEADYLKMADLFIIDCGSSTVNVHERPQA